MKKLTVSAPGKTIIAGEHAVVYGYPAVVAAIDRRLSLKIEYEPTVLDGEKVKSILESFSRSRASEVLEQLHSLTSSDFSVDLQSDIPIGSGLGSSAALAVVLTRTLLELTDSYRDLEQVNELAHLLEKVMHINASGVDNTIVTFGGVLRYQRREGKVLLEPIKPRFHLDRFWLIQSGKPVETTGEMVQLVARAREQDPDKYQKIFEQIGEISGSWIMDESSDEAIINRIKLNHRLLSQVGVVSNSTSSLIDEIEKLGGAAKISGAGGVKTGSGMLLAFHADSQTIRDFVERKKLTAFPVSISSTGVELSQPA